MRGFNSALSRRGSGLVGLAVVGALVAGCGGQVEESTVHAGTRQLSGPVVAEQAPSQAPSKAASKAPNQAPSQTPSEAPPTKEVSASPQAPTPSRAVSTPTPPATPGDATPVLPPGDPGPDAPSVPDPGAPEGPRSHDEPGRQVVPPQAMLDTQTVSGVLGGGTWQAGGGKPLDCLTGTDRVAQRSTTFRVGDQQVLQTVSTYRSLDAADRAARRAAQELRACGWSGVSDPRLGTAATSATLPADDGQLLVVAAEGVTVTLVGTGVSAGPARWTSLADLALGNSCAAAPDGCH